MDSMKEIMALLKEIDEEDDENKRGDECSEGLYKMVLCKCLRR